MTGLLSLHQGQNYVRKSSQVSRIHPAPIQVLMAKIMKILIGIWSLTVSGAWFKCLQNVGLRFILQISVFIRLCSYFK